MYTQTTAKMATTSAILVQLPQVKNALLFVSMYCDSCSLFRPLSLAEAHFQFFLVHGADQGAAERPSVQAASSRVQQC